MIVPDGTEYYRSTAEMPAELADVLRQYAYLYGETYDSYLATDSHREMFWCRGRRGAVSFVRWGRRYVQVVGGLLGAREHHETLVDDFVEYVRANRLNVTFYNIGRDNLEPFRKHGFQITKCGEEPIVRLDKTTWRGKPYEWVRRQENYCLRQGVELVEVDPDPLDPEYRERIAPELDEVSREHIAATLHGRELQHFVGTFESLSLRPKRLFVARRDARIEAFLVCNPCLAGTMWAVEIYRRRPEATRGIVAFAILRTMRLLKEEGISYCSLSLVPAVRCDTALKGDSWVYRVTMGFWWRYLNWVFDLRGIYHFKSRFRPEYREMYVAALPKVTVVSMFALGWSWGVILFNPWRLLRHSLGKWQKMGSRKSLAMPSWRPGRVLRKLNGRPASTNGQSGASVRSEDHVQKSDVRSA